jgi:hypothetical protein
MEHGNHEGVTLQGPRPSLPFLSLLPTSNKYALEGLSMEINFRHFMDYFDMFLVNLTAYTYVIYLYVVIY